MKNGEDGGRWNRTARWRKGRGGRGSRQGWKYRAVRAQGPNDNQFRASEFQGDDGATVSHQTASPTKPDCSSLPKATPLSSSPSVVSEFTVPSAVISNGGGSTEQQGPNTRPQLEQIGYDDKSEHRLDALSEELGSAAAVDVNSERGDQGRERAEGAEQEIPGRADEEYAEALRILQELRLEDTGRETTPILPLTEDQIRVNDQLQMDELFALEAIYGDKLSVFNRKGGLPFFQIHIDLEIPQALSISVHLDSSAGKLSKSNVQDGDVPADKFTYTFEVNYLPPVALTCMLPLAYPSHVPPLFTLCVPWLDISKISKLCAKLDDIWSEQPGQEVLFQWVDWLHASSLSFLDLENEITMSASDVSASVDKRAISGNTPYDAYIPVLIAYNDGKCHEAFLNSVHVCLICFTDYPGTDFIILPCKHFFCKKCLETYCNIHVKEGTVTKLSCPMDKCNSVIPPGLLRQVLRDSDYERWESLLLQKTLDSMADVVYCPRCETGCLEDEENHAQCTKCYFSFCTLCRDRRHVGNACMTPEAKLLLLQERQKSSGTKDNKRQKELDLINELLSLKEIHQSAKQCPSCKIAIFKTEGCNKMACQNCGQYFCYRCNKKISGYDHFSAGNCVLFEREEIMNWERQVNEQQLRAQVHVELFPNRAHACPNCGQLNAKFNNNNHMSCWACQNRYCALCHKNVPNSRLHYGPKGCKQHTVDS